ncbi:MAG: hypothetical protein AB8G96_10075 [Phycisphaerales bacterium]
MTNAHDQTKWGTPEGATPLDVDIVTNDAVAGRWLDVMASAADASAVDEDLRIVEAVAHRIGEMHAHLIDHQVHDQLGSITGLDPELFLTGTASADALTAARKLTRKRVSDGTLEDADRDWALVVHLMITAEAAGRHGIMLGSRSPDVLRPYLIEIAAVLPERWTGGLLAAIEA